MRNAALFLSFVVIFTIPWQNAVTIGSIGTLTKAIGAVTAVVWIVSILVTGNFRRPHQLHTCMSLFVLWSVASLLWTKDVHWTVIYIGCYFQLIMLSYILWDLYRTKEALKAAMFSYILGTYVTVLSVIHNYVTGQTAYRYAQGRFTGSGLNADDLALVLTLGLPIAWHVATTAGTGMKGRLLSAVSYASIPASLIATTLTASRMAFFASIPALFYIFGTATRLRPLARVLIFGLILGLLFAAKPYIPNSSITRLASAGESLSGSDLGGRVELWRFAGQRFVDNPVLGVGSGALHSFRELGDVAHNTFLSILAELGSIGFMLFLFMLATVAWQASRQPKPMSLLWITILACWTIGVSTLTWEYTKPTWLFMSLVVISANVRNYRAESGAWMPEDGETATELLATSINQ